MASCDICMLYSSQDADKWCKYLKHILNQAGTRNRYVDARNYQINLKELQSCHAIAMLATSELVEQLVKTPKPLCDILNNHPCVVVILCYLEESDLSDIKRICPRETSWKYLSTGENKEENTNMIGHVVGALEAKLHLDEMTRSRRPERQKPVTIIPDHVYKLKEKVAIIFDEPPTGTVQVKIGNESTMHDAKKQNGYTFILSVKHRFIGWTKVKVLVDGKQITEIPFCFESPFLGGFKSVGFLAHLLGVGDGDVAGLDAKLVQIYEESMPEDLTLHKMAQESALANPVGKSSHTLPTLLHFAAKYGLSDLCVALLDTPGSINAFQIDNKDGMDPADLADKEGHSELAAFMRMFIDTAAVVEACDDIYISMKGLHLHGHKEQVDKHKYDSTAQRKTSAKKKKLPPVPESSRKLLETERFSVEEVAEEDDVTEHKVDEVAAEDDVTEDTQYMDFGDTNVAPPTRERMNLGLPLASSSQDTAVCPNPDFTPGQFFGMEKCSYKEVMSPGSLGSKAQDELVEIGKGVSEGDFSVSEAEMLYMSWKERNSAKSVSVRERHQALEELRSTYSRTFNQAYNTNTELGSKTLLQKIKSKFKGRKKSIVERDIVIEHKTHTLPKSSTRSMSNRSSTSSSSSAGSRDSVQSTSSRDSALQRSDSEDEGDNICIKRRDIKRRRDSSKRLSMRERFLKHAEQSESIDDPPPVPPRLPRQS